MIGYSISEYPVQFTDSPPVPPNERRQIREIASSRFAAVTNTEISEISQIFRQAVPEIDLTLSMKLVEKIFVYKCILSLALLHLADMFTNKLKTRLIYIYTCCIKKRSL